MRQQQQREQEKRNADAQQIQQAKDQLAQDAFNLWMKMKVIDM